MELWSAPKGSGKSFLMMRTIVEDLLQRDDHRPIVTNLDIRFQKFRAYMLKHHGIEITGKLFVRPCQGQGAVRWARQFWRDRGCDSLVVKADFDNDSGRARIQAQPDKEKWSVKSIVPLTTTVNVTEPIPFWEQLGRRSAALINGTGGFVSSPAAKTKNVFGVQRSYETYFIGSAIRTGVRYRLDEIQKSFRAAEYALFAAEADWYLSIEGQLDDHVIIATQHPNLMEITFHRQTNTFCEIVNAQDRLLWGFRWFRVFIKRTFGEPPTDGVSSDTLKLYTDRYMFDQELADCYRTNSASGGSVGRGKNAQRKLRGLSIWWLFGIILIGFVLVITAPYTVGRWWVNLVPGMGKGTGKTRTVLLTNSVSQFTWRPGIVETLSRPLVPKTSKVSPDADETKGGSLVAAAASSYDGPSGRQDRGEPLNSQGRGNLGSVSVERPLIKATPAPRPRLRSVLGKVTGGMQVRTTAGLLVVSGAEWDGDGIKLGNAARWRIGYEPEGFDLAFQGGWDISGQHHQKLVEPLQ